MAHIKIDGWKNAYDRIIASKYLKTLDYKKQTERYIASFDEYKDLVLVAVRGEEVLGYSCYQYFDRGHKFDSELVSLYIKPEYKELCLNISTMFNDFAILFSSIMIFIFDNTFMKYKE